MTAIQTFDYLAIKPIAAPIEPRKQGAKRHWGSHPYFTRSAWNVVKMILLFLVNHWQFVKKRYQHKACKR